MNKFTDDIIQNIKREYLSGASIPVVAQRLNISKTSVGNYVKRLGISRKYHRTKQENQEFRVSVKNLYLSGMTEKEVAEKMKSNIGIINYYVADMGIARPRGAQSSIGNEDYFDSIDTQRKAYWLGWLMADGNVSEYQGQFAIKVHIQENDRVLLETFMKDLDVHNKIDERVYFYKGKWLHSVYSSFSSKHMVKTLESYGVIPAKTGHERIPKNIPEDMIRHFIRGYFDGDGHVIISKNPKIKSYAFGFTAPKAMCEDIQRYLNEETAIVQRIGVCQMSYGKKKGKKLFDEMYSEADFYLSRKHDPYKAVYCK